MAASDLTSEFGLIDWIRQRERVRANRSRSPSWRSATMSPILDVGSRSNLLVTTDMLMDGRHFRLEARRARASRVQGPRRELVGYRRHGRRAPRCTRRGRVAASTVPRSWRRESMPGMATLADRFGVDLIGGDTNAWNGPLVISVTLIGEATARGAVCRSGAKPGDVILVTGALGGSLACRPPPAPRAESRRGARASRIGAIARSDRYLGWTLVGPLAHPDRERWCRRRSR